jgi:hypothetical protein
MRPRGIQYNWDTLDSEKVDLLRTIDSYVVDLNRTVNQGGLLEEDAFLYMANWERSYNLRPFRFALSHLPGGG